MGEEIIDIEQIARYLDKTATEAEKEELLHWISQSKENERFFFTMKDLYEAGNWSNLQYEAHTPQTWKQLKSKIETIPGADRKKSHKLLPLLKYAAVFAVGVLLSTWFLRPDKSNIINPDFKNNIVTGIGERSQLVLPDGTHVWVNSCSSVSFHYDYGTKSRNVYLKGEAYFKVAKNAKLPFIVHASGIAVKALGTSFNVTAYDNDNVLSAVLLEGSIRFEQTKTGKARVIKPGEKISFTKTSQKISIENVNAESYVTWSTGETRFEHLKMEEITKRLQRAYNVNFVLENEKIKNMNFTGTFRNYESLDQILKVINTNTNLNCKLIRDTVFMK